MRARDKVAIGWLDPGQVDGMFMLSVASIYAERHSRVGGLLRVHAGGLLSRGRNELVAMFMENTPDCDWLLMLDSDEQLSLPAFDKLIDSVHDTERPIVAGLYFGILTGGTLYPTATPLIFRQVPDSTRFLPIVDYPPDSLIPIDSAGTGCLLIHRSVFEAFQKVATPHEGTRWCWFRDMPVNGDWYGEDNYFCSTARSLGFPIYANTSVILPHHKNFWLTDKHQVR